MEHFERFAGTGPLGEPGLALLPFAGSLDDSSAREMTEAIESGCEAMDPREW